MIRLLIFVLIALKLAAPVQAQEEAGAIQGVITSQLEAFKTDDFAAAYSFASPMIQGIFRDADTFGLMVRNGFPMVWRPSDVQFKDLTGEGNIYAQRVLIQDGQGVYYLLEYEMIKASDGWQINGVSLLEKPPVGV